MIQMKVFSSTINSIGQVSVDEMEDSIDEAVEGHTSQGDIVDVQMDGEHEIYKKEDGQLYFKPYGKEDRVSAYFSNDMIKVER